MTAYSEGTILTKLINFSQLSNSLMQLLDEENQKLPFPMLTECMVCFVLIISKNNTSKLKVLGRNLDFELVKQKYIQK